MAKSPKPNQAPEEPATEEEQALPVPTITDIIIALINATLQDGQPELQRAEGRRGILDMYIAITLGDNGKPIHADTRLAFTQKRHIKDK